MCGAVLAAALIALVLCVKPGAEEPRPDPVLFREDGEAYLAAGYTAIRLNDAVILDDYIGDTSWLDAMVSYDKNTLYYMADVNSNGECDIMRIALWDENAESVRIAQDVYQAEISRDGARILYVTNGEDGEYELCICTPGGEPEEIADSVSPYNFGFSPNGQWIYYITTDGGIEQELMLYANGKNIEVAEYDEGISSFIYLDDSGRMLYSIFGDQETLYLYEDGDTERVARDIENVEAVFTRADEFLYETEDDALYSYIQGDDERVSDEFYWARFAPTGVYDSASEDKHFLLVEGDSDDRQLFEMSLPGEPVEIGKADGTSIIDRNFRYCVYEWDGTLYLSAKSGSGWSEGEEVCQYPIMYWFDSSGTVLYYIEADHASDEAGEFCGLDLSSRKTEQLMDGVSRFLVSGGQAYAVTDDGDAYRVSGGDAERIGEDVAYLFDAEGGVYLWSESSGIYYCSGSDSERLSRDAELLWYTYSLTRAD